VKKAEAHNCNNLLQIITGRYKKQGSGRPITQLNKTNNWHRMTEQNKLNTDTNEPKPSDTEEGD